MRSDTPRRPLATSASQLTTLADARIAIAIDKDTQPYIGQ